MNRIAYGLPASLLFAAGLAQAHCCSGDMPKPMKPSASATTPSVSMPLVDGEVKKIDTEKGLIVLKHGDLPNLAMPAMTMGFDVADRKMLDGLKVGDRVKSGRDDSREGHRD
jgi:Cu(I)/Ag(I) efflux system membrane protein CusA/SilA